MQETAVKWRIAMAAISAIIAVLFGLLGSVVSILAFLVAIPFAIAAIILWRQASTRLSGVSYRRRSTGSKGRDGPRDRGNSTERRRQYYDSREERQSAPTYVSAAEARSVLDIPPDADDATVRKAYRRRIKEVHPDQGGEEEEFRRVTAAYERLREQDGSGDL